MAVRLRSPPHAATSSWFMSLSSARTESVYLRYAPMFLRMAVGSWAVMLCLGPLVVGSVPAVSWRRELLHRAGIVEVVGEILAARGECPGGGVDRLANRYQIPRGCPRGGLTRRAGRPRRRSRRLRERLGT